MSKQVTPPQTPKEWAAYRCKMSCSLGRDVIQGREETPDGYTRLEFAVCILLHAIEDLVEVTASVKEKE